MEGGPRAPQGHAPALACVREGHLRPGLVENEEASPRTAARGRRTPPPTARQVGARTSLRAAELVRGRGLPINALGGILCQTCALQGQGQGIRLSVPPVGGVSARCPPRAAPRAPSAPSLLTQRGAGAAISPALPLQPSSSARGRRPAASASSGPRSTSPEAAPAPAGSAFSPRLTAGSHTEAELGAPHSSRDPRPPECFFRVYVHQGQSAW